MRNQLTIDFSLMRHNLNTVKKTIPEGCGIIAVVKANAYGHGAVPVARWMQDSYGIEMFAVAGLDEALELRAGGITKDILVLGFVDPADLETVVKNNVTIPLIGPEHALAVSEKAGELGVKANVHIKLNTGMNRIGFDCKSFKQMMAIAGVYQLPNLNFTGIFSHFSSSDDTSSGADPYTRLQLERFSKVVSYLSERGIKTGLRHISNSGAIGKYPQARFDAVRCGALTYGYNTAMDAKLNVTPVMEWKATISMTRTLEFGDAVSYARRFVASEPTKVATLCVGYADGYPRNLCNKGTVLINGQKCKVLGTVCMDQMMVDISELKETPKMGDTAVIIGKSGNLVQTADDIAEQTGTCMHTVLSTIMARVERVYVGQ